MIFMKNIFMKKAIIEKVMINTPKESIMNNQLDIMNFFSWSNALKENNIPNGINMKRYGKEILSSVENIL